MSRTDVVDRQNTSRRLVVLALLLIPALGYVSILPYAGHLQYNDYYGILGSVVDGHHFTHDPVRWLTVKSNEHTVALSVGIYVANLMLTGGDNLGLSVFSLAMMVASALLMWSFVPERFRQDRHLSLLLAPAVGMLALTPVAVHNIVLGFSGTLWLTANALSLAALRCVVSGADRGGQGRFVAAGVLGLGAALAYSTGIAVWPALLVAAVVLRVPWRRVAILAVPAALDVAFEVLSYTRPAALPAPETTRLGLLVRFLAVYLGQVFARPRVMAGILGLVCLVACVGVVVWVLRTGGARRDLGPWLAVGVYGLTNAVVTTIARAKLGGARSSRYATLACMVWAAVLIGVVWAIERMSPGSLRRWLARTLALVATLAVIAMSVRGLGLFADYLDRAALQPVARIAWIYGIDDPESLESISVAPHQLWGVRPWLTSLGHVPFDATPDVSAGEKPPGTISGECDGVVVRSEETVEVGGGVLRLRGSVRGPWRGRRVLLVDHNGSVRGLGVRLTKPPVTRRSWPKDGVAWGGYLFSADPGGYRFLLETTSETWCRAGSARLRLPAP